MEREMEAFAALYQQYPQHPVLDHLNRCRVALFHIVHPLTADNHLRIAGLQIGVRPIPEGHEDLIENIMVAFDREVGNYLDPEERRLGQEVFNQLDDDDIPELVDDFDDWADVDDEPPVEEHVVILHEAPVRRLREAPTQRLPETLFLYELEPQPRNKIST